MTNRLSSSGRERTANEWFTPSELTSSLLEHIDVDWSKPNLRVLEPSAGEGAMIEVIVDKLMVERGCTRQDAEACVDACELEVDNCEVLKSKFPNVSLRCGSFI